ncbi:rCG51473 [Rattus norvegicus]|uniref:RCG51473 n=1 Tax=Rattus norvegicus TaxID=10116 RepID=A6IZF2_RAT|nr:rCG51473 [Rattus norvegicus]
MISAESAGKVCFRVPGLPLQQEHFRGQAGIFTCMYVKILLVEINCLVV